MGFKPTTPVFERAKTVHALDRVATVIGSLATNGFTKFKVSRRKSVRKLVSRRRIQ
jgi:hypothetical protein